MKTTIARYLRQIAGKLDPLESPFVDGMIITVTLPESTDESPNNEPKIAPKKKRARKDGQMSGPITPHARMFQTEFGLSDLITWQSIPGKVISITFRENGITYEIEFAAGGSHGFVPADEVHES